MREQAEACRRRAGRSARPLYGKIFPDSVRQWQKAALLHTMYYKPLACGGPFNPANQGGSLMNYYPSNSCCDCGCSSEERCCRRRDGHGILVPIIAIALLGGLFGGWNGHCR